jgi:hypothetical protein
MERRRLSFLVLLATAVCFFAYGSLHAEANPSGEVAEEGTAARWMQDVRREIAANSCRFHDEATGLAFARDFAAESPSRTSRAQLLPSEGLIAAREIQQYLACPHADKNELGGQLREERDLLLLAVERRVRAQVSLLRRAQIEGDDESSLARLADLSALLEAHEGPATEELALLRARYTAALPGSE